MAVGSALAQKGEGANGRPLASKCGVGLAPVQGGPVSCTLFAHGFLGAIGGLRAGVGLEADGAALPPKARYQPTVRETLGRPLDVLRRGR